MSIIGPRPLLVSYLPWYTEEEKQRHDVRPGLSGLAQVNGRNSVTWEEKFSWDLKYVDRIVAISNVKIRERFQQQINPDHLPVLIHPNAYVVGTVKIGNRTWIGTGATVNNNLNICGDCMVGAVVIKDIKEPGTSIGHPFPAVCIRTSTERPEALDKGGFVLAGIDGASLIQAVCEMFFPNSRRLSNSIRSAGGQCCLF